MVNEDFEFGALAPGAGNTMIAGGGFTQISGVSREGVALLTTGDATS